jgi:rhodanese-related sulfurtransferase
VGLELIAGFTPADEKQWRHHGIRLVTLPMFACKDAGRNQQKGRTRQLIDVRSSAEWLKGHLPGAISIPLLELNGEAPSIDLSQPSLVYCHEGYRATTAASVLLRRNARDVGIMIDVTECIDRPQCCGVQGMPSDGLVVSSLVHF